MDKIIELAKELRKEIDLLPLFQEYQKVKKAYLGDQEIQELKKQVVRTKNENRKQENDLYLKKLNNHPLFVNYHVLKEEVTDYLRQISEILNEK